MNELNDIYSLILFHFKDNVNFSELDFLKTPYKHKSLTFKCSNCGKYFKRSKEDIFSSLRKSKSPKSIVSLRYCCKDCHIKDNRITKSCLYCGKPVTKRKNEALKSPNFFCNKSCSAKYNNKHRSIDYSNIFSNRKYKSYNGIDLTKVSPKEYRSYFYKICSLQKQKKKITIIPKKHQSNKLKRANKIKPKKCIICGQYNCTNKEICGWESLKRKSKNLIKLGFDFSTFGTPKIVDSFNDFRNKLIHEYESKSMTQIRKDYGIRGDKTVQDIFKHLNISLISNKEHMKKYLANGGLAQPLKGKPLLKHIKKDGKTIFFRSSYEKNFALHLESLNVDYEYESKHFSFKSSIDNEKHYSIPDFYIPTLNLLIEVKSWFYYDKLRMLDRFKSYSIAGYNCKLLLEDRFYSILPPSKDKNFFTLYPKTI